MLLLVLCGPKRTPEWLAGPLYFLKKYSSMFFSLKTHHVRAKLLEPKESSVEDADDLGVCILLYFFNYCLPLL